MSSGALPPPPAPPRREGLPDRVRRPIGIAATVLALVAAALFALSFVPGSARRWSAWSFIPIFLLTFPVFFAFAFDQGWYRNGGGSMPGLPPQLRGWRAVVALLALLVAGATMFLGFGRPAGGGVLREQGGRYWVVDQGRSTELTEEEWAERSAGNNRPFVAVPMYLLTLAALCLTARPGPPEVSTEQQLGRRGSAARRIGGEVRCQVGVAASTDVLLQRLRAVVPVQALPGSTPGGWRVVAEWEEEKSWPFGRLPLRLEGTVTSNGAGASRLDAVIAPTSQHRLFLPVQAVWALVVVGLGVVSFVALGAPPVVLAFLAVWAAWGGFLAYWYATVGRRRSRAARDRLATAVRADR